MTRRFSTPAGASYTALAGVHLSAPAGGLIEVFGEKLAGLNRRAAYMFQQDALLPWKTALDNVAGSSVSD